jgi:hypothetical protein
MRFDVLDKGHDAKGIAVRYEAFWLETETVEGPRQRGVLHNSTVLENETLGFE